MIMLKTGDALANAQSLSGTGYTSEIPIGEILNRRPPDPCFGSILPGCAAPRQHPPHVAGDPQSTSIYHP